MLSFYVPFRVRMIRSHVLHVQLFSSRKIHMVMVSILLPGDNIISVLGVRSRFGQLVRVGHFHGVDCVRANLFLAVHKYAHTSGALLCLSFLVHPVTAVQFGQPHVEVSRVPLYHKTAVPTFDYDSPFIFAFVYFQKVIIYVFSSKKV